MKRGMKATIIAFGVAIAIAVVVGVGYFVNIGKNQIAIVNVFSEQTKAVTKLQVKLQGVKTLPDTQRTLKDYAQAVQAIDVSWCPTDFRLAWFDYVSAVTDLSEKNLAASAIKDVLALAMSVYTKDGKLTENVMQDADILSNPRSCLRRCQRIAIGYGVRFRPIVNQQQN